MLACACLYWVAGIRYNIFIFAAVGPISTLIAVAGAVVLSIVLYTQWLPRRGEWATAGVVMWVLVPVVAGPIFALVVSVQLERYYQSTAYDTWYDAWSGVTIAPQEQSFHYTDCSLDGYTATYQITALRATELGFALLDRDRANAKDVRDDLERPIGAQLDDVWMASYPFVDDGIVLGTYHVPAGAHTLVVEAGSPFQLSILDSHPLWTPDAWLAGEERYHTIYSDDHTWEETTLAAAKALPAGCSQPDLDTMQSFDTAAKFAAMVISLGAFSLERRYRHAAGAAQGYGPARFEF